MKIHRLPEAVINKLKAGEIVERPASALKELIENSLDAGATYLTITLEQGGKDLIKVQDNGTGISNQETDLVLERYATSKIQSESDLFSLSSYGFRGEALASISEVSHMMIQTKTSGEQVATMIEKKEQRLTKESVSVAFDHGTTVYVRDLFFNVPVRRTFLKSAQTEYKYCHEIMKSFALLHPDKQRTLIHNDKTIFDVQPAENIIERIAAIYKKEWSSSLQIFSAEQEGVSLQGVIGDSGLRFSHQNYIQFFVNDRLVTDKILKKASFDALRRQLHPHEYPFLLLFVTVDPELIDVNVHPRKINVKYLDTSNIYSLTRKSIEQHLGDNKIATSRHHNTDNIGQAQPYAIPSPSFKPGINGRTMKQKPFENAPLLGGEGIGVRGIYQQAGSIINQPQSSTEISIENTSYIIIGQLRKTYIILQAEDALLYIDQHALAERIAYEKLIKQSHHISTPQQLLQAHVLTLPETITDQHINKLTRLGREASILGEKKIAIYAVPDILYERQLDLEKAILHILSNKIATLTQLLEDIYATKACKASIKAGQKLSLTEMSVLLEDGLTYIPGGFVCQHGRPFALSFPKKDIDTMFDRT